MPELVLKLGDNVIQTYVFDKDIMSIGRSRDNDVVIENLSVSRNHARIRNQNGKFVLTDLNSANGTFVNGTKVTKTEIVDTDVISIGKHKIYFSNKVLDEQQIVADAFGQDRTMVVDRSPQPVICITDGKLKGTEFTLTKFETSIGKAQDNDIVIGDDWFLSKKQAVIYRRGAEYELHDLGGFRKTKVNGVPLNEPRILKPGDLVELGNTRCIFQYAAEVAPNGRVPQEMAADDSIFSSGIDIPEAAQAQDRTAAATEQNEAEHQSATPAEFQDPPSLDSEDEDLQTGGTGLSEAAAMENGNGAGRAGHSESIADEAPQSAAPQQRRRKRDRQREMAGAAAVVGMPDKSADAPEAAEPEQPGSSSAPFQPAQEFGDQGDFREDIIRSVSPNIPLADVSPDDSDSPASPEFREPVSDQSPPETEGSGEPGPVRWSGGEEAMSDEQIAADPDLQREISLWESALNNRSTVIRRQAAKTLKKLTGRDYEI